MSTALYSNYVSGSDNYGHQLVATQNGIRYDGISDGTVSTVWEISKNLLSDSGDYSGTSNAWNLRFISVGTFDRLIYYYDERKLTVFVVTGNSGAPTTASRWFGMQYLNAESNYGWQLTWSFLANELYFRRRYGSTTFTAWYKVSMTAV